MRKNICLPLLSAALLSAVVACNSSDDDQTTYVQSSSVIVSGFYIKDNSAVLDSLSNVYFSIDLVNARIFNADSLPYGTKVNRLIPSITTATYASAVTLSYYCPETGRDSLVNFLTNSSDSIDFSAGPVKLSVTSQSGAVVRDYEIKVNVHQVKADSLAWYSIARATLPSSFGTIKAQRTVCFNDTYYCLTSDGSACCMATTDDPASPQWSVADIDFGFTPDIDSFSASADALYILGTDGALYTSTDCLSWSATSQTWCHIYGGYGNQVLGCTLNPSGWYDICSYPALSATHAPDGFPVKGTSQLVSYDLSMGFGPQAIMLGGVSADGSLTDACWGYDGSGWAELSQTPLPLELRDVTLVAYPLVDTPASTWTPQEYPVVLAIGGRNSSDAINRTIYYSRDWGMNWAVAPDLVTLPAEVTSFYGATAYVYTSIMNVEARSAHWTELPVRSLPAQCRWLDAPASRAVYPVTEWRSPAFYVFGGYAYGGTAIDALWRAVILQYTFKPVE